MPEPSKKLKKIRKAVFLDRDGVINIDLGYVIKKSDFIFRNEVFDFISAARVKGYSIVIVTNQSGVGRGYFSESELNELMAWVCEELSRRGSPVDRYYYSPFHPTLGLGRYRKDDFTRKPNPGMILQASKELAIDLAESVLIGDRMSDIKAGLSAGLKHNFLLEEGSADGIVELKKFYRTNCLENVIKFL